VKKLPFYPQPLTALASQNARKHRFNPEPFAIVRIEDCTHIAALVADAGATYKPINSHERAFWK
jgi:hypothetical protein